MAHSATMTRSTTSWFKGPAGFAAVAALAGVCVGLRAFLAAR